MQAFILIVHVFVALILIGLILLQHGKGADAGASFGSGASQTIFGSQGSTSFLVKITSVLAFVFFTTSLILGYMNLQQFKGVKRNPSAPMQQLPVSAPNTSPKSE